MSDERVIRRQLIESAIRLTKRYPRWSWTQLARAMPGKHSWVRGRGPHPYSSAGYRHDGAFLNG